MALIGIGDTSQGRPSLTTGHTGPYYGCSTGLSFGRDTAARETEGVEVPDAQCLLNRRMSGDAPEPRRRTGRDRCIELWDATTAQFFEAIGPILPLPRKI
jgi:hypothetical protein